jgi:hypothetical protein
MKRGPPPGISWTASVFQYYYYRLIVAAAVVVSVLPACVVPFPTGSTTTAAGGARIALSSVMMTTTSTAAAAPLYITVGPPCAGKTTWIQRRQRELQDQQSIIDETKKPQLIHDVSIDDQDGVYVPVPTSWFLNGQHHHKKSQESDADDDSGCSAAAARRLILHGKSAYDRIQDQVELRAILARLSNQITPADCAAKLGQPSSEATRGIVAAVEEYIMLEHANTAAAPEDTMTIQLPDTIDLFVVEALFRDDRPAANHNHNNNNNHSNNHHNHNHNHNNNNNNSHRHHQNQHPNTSTGGRSTGIGTATTATTSTSPASSSRTKGGGGGDKGGAIARAGQVLRDHIITDAVVWGNTNCRSTDYQDALQLALRQSRPVHFVVYSEPDDDDDDDNDSKNDADDDNDTTGQEQQQGLHAKNLQELFQRSIARLVRTGRYIPSTVICDMRRRCLEMTNITTIAKTNHRPDMMMTATGIELECHLARLAQYELDPVTRQVRALSSPKRRLPNHDNDGSPQRGGRSIHPPSANTRTAGRFVPPSSPPREPWRGGMLPGMNQYGNYRATTTNSSIPRGGRWGGGGSQLHQPGGGGYRSGDRDDSGRGGGGANHRTGR